MPVTRIVASVDWSVKAGAPDGWRASLRANLSGLVDWLADHVDDATERALPTGTVIGWPVSITS